MDSKKIPFSLHKSYYVAMSDETDRLYIKTLRSGVKEQKIMYISTKLSKSMTRLTEGAIELEGDSDDIKLTFVNSKEMCYCYRGSIQMDLIQASQIIKIKNDHYKAYFGPQNVVVHFYGKPSKVEMDWDGDNATHIQLTYKSDHYEEGRIIFEEEGISPNTDEIKDFATAEKDNRESFELFMAQTPDIKNGYYRTYRLAKYILWSSLVEKKGLFKRDAVLVSKNWMSRIWSWDNAFHALGLLSSDIDMAWDQIMLPFELQSIEGSLPDSFTDNYSSWYSTKPPIYGWIMEYLLKREVLSNEKLNEIFHPLCALTDWWLDYRDSDMNGIPEYYNGNDSGWDNSTAFYYGVPIESPDLIAYLILQCDVISKVGKIIGKDTSKYQSRQSELLRVILNDFWFEDHFRIKCLRDNKYHSSESLLMFLPLILKKRLPQNIRLTLISRLKGFCGNYGLASEHPESVLYKEDSYWRGPIWSPPMLMLLDVLKEEDNLFYEELKKGYLKAIDNIGYFPENLGFLSGEPYRDPTINWTAATFITLCEW